MNTMLYGVMVTQTFYYYSNYARDSKWLKYYVGILFLADTMNTIFNMWFIYNVLVNQFGSLKGVALANWLFETGKFPRMFRPIFRSNLKTPAEEAMAGIIGLQVQLFYAWRIRQLTGKKWLVGLIVTLSVIGCLMALGTAIGIAFRPEITQLDRYKQFVSTWLAAAACADITISVSLIYYLHTRRTGLPRTDTLITRLIQLTMSYGLLTSSFALIDIIAFFADSGGLHLAFNYTLCKLYSNSMMSSLNSRDILSTVLTAHSTFQVASVPMDSNRPVSTGVKSSTTQVVIGSESHKMVNMSRRSLNLAGDTASDLKVKAVV
ncbi:uncharacterized protein LAESUDRAFT_813307 [Laetiporus sulphureus 93-53]|uniref:DUF6534 domain-containing protein n=1 Tax=Laetiporus sulphureus 93-53 TaxID=1314785 RepID=A0A165DWQ5_9APHY|nr:uncharacterized protein LAESUDRAFT_813307 [Laetiporus sulphureus 93-53]KZT05784.1 hypothetical protein LAESUDRAFT_813307 [Laetiporus sulphureus 93-53]